MMIDEKTKDSTETEKTPESELNEQKEPAPEAENPECCGGKPNEESDAEAKNEKDVKGDESDKADKSDKTDKKDKKGDVKKLKVELEAANKALAEEKKKTEDLNDKYLRLAAEYDNFRKRSQTERKNIYGDAVNDTLKGILPIIDNLRYAEKYSGGDSEKVAEGVNLILGKLPETLEKIGVAAYGEVGEKFDPALHNAVMHVEDESLGEGEIVEVLQQGYKYGDKVLRYAMVKVAN